MQDSILRFSLDIHSTQSQVSIPVPQFDTARSIMATLTEGGKPYQLTDDCRAVFTGTKADGNPLFNDCMILNGSVIRYDFTEQTAAVVGLVDCRIKVYGANGKILTSPRLALLVYDGDDFDYTPSDAELNALNKIMEDETSRAVAESERVIAEEKRVDAEEARAVAEEKRVAAENLREKAEQEREVAFGAMNTAVTDLGVQVVDLDKQVDDLQEQFDNLDVTVEIPYFDLVSIGLAVIPRNDTAVKLETDTTEIMAALQNGAVRFRVKVEYAGLQMDAICTMHDVTGVDGSAYFCSSPFSFFGIPMLVNITVEEGSISASWNVLKKDTGEEETTEIPSFDLVALGLPAVPMDGNEVLVQTDTTEIRAALDKGAVRFSMQADMGGEVMPFDAVMTPMRLTDAETSIYMCSKAVTIITGEILNISIIDGAIVAMVTTVGGAKASTPATSIDLSALDTEGKVVETYADGTSKATTLEFDSNGNPVKITDGDGNVTTLIW